MTTTCRSSFLRALSPRLVLIAAGLLLISAPPARAEGDEPLVWPTVRFSRTQGLAAGVAFQPRSGLLDRLVLTATAGHGGTLAGIGVGSFGHNMMAGAATHATWLRTMGHPRRGDANRTYVGVEGEIMAANISFRAGPLVRLGGPSAGSDRLLIGFSVGYGF
jgi:hypothetical protein